MIKINEKETCSGCYACVSACPKGCISMKTDEEGFRYPEVDENICIECGLCEKKCPIINPIETKKNESDIVVYAAYNKSEQIRMKSSSGGIFKEIANYVIGNGGVVFGAAFNHKFDVNHIYAKTKEQCELFQGSKYVQSNIGNTYQETENFLKEGKLVLFTGTPCQIGGLYKYLNKEYTNLLTVDIVCHGVPSPMVWEEYCKFREKKDEGRLEKVSFRDKRFGWKTYSLLFKYTGDNEYIKKYVDDIYMKPFLYNYSLRPSCYECSFKTVIRESDITLGDFWGVEQIFTDMDDDKGTSLVMLNSGKGKEVFESIKKNIEYKLTDLNTAVRYNSAMIKSVARPSGREDFMKDIFREDFKKVVRRYCRVKASVRLAGVKHKILIVLSCMKRKIIRNRKKKINS